MHLFYVEINTISKQTQTSFHLTQRHVGVPSAGSKMIYEPMVRSVQTVHLSCTNINTISLWTKTSFHLTHFPKSSIGSDKNDFRANCMFQANSILCQD
jgi:hypothetical protein